MRKRLLIPPTLRRRGAPLGNRNALKHGRCTRERRALYADVRAYIEQSRALAAHVKSLGEFLPAEPQSPRRVPSSRRPGPRDARRTHRAAASARERRETRSPSRRRRFWPPNRSFGAPAKARKTVLEQRGNMKVTSRFGHFLARSPPCRWDRILNRRHAIFSAVKRFGTSTNGTSPLYWDLSGRSGPSASKDTLLWSHSCVGPARLSPVPSTAS